MNTLTDCKITGNSTTGFDGGLNLKFWDDVHADRLAPSAVDGADQRGRHGQLRHGNADQLHRGAATPPIRLTRAAARGRRGPTTLIGCTISGNSALAGGGGLYIYGGGSATLTNCTIRGNSAGGNGGGLDNSYGGSTTLTNCTISGNLAVAGGGVYNSGTLSVASTNIINNRARGGAGGAGEEGGIFSNGGSVARQQQCAEL